MAPPSVSVIVPVYNEDRTVLELLSRVKKQQDAGLNLEIIVINDGSTDRTVELLETRPDLYSKFINRKQNQGKGAAVIAGLQEATGDYVLFQDADLEYDPADYGFLMQPVVEFDADVVMGSRFRSLGMARVTMFWHWVGNKIVTLLFNMLNNTTFTDIYTCYLMYRRDLLDPNDLRVKGWAQHAEILGLVVRKADLIYEVPVNYFSRSYAEGKKIRGHHAIGVIATIFRTRLR